jgi:hypothetical protein
VSATVAPGEASLSIVPQGGDPIELAYTDIDDLFDDDYTMRLTDWGGRRYDLTMFGKAYGQILADVTTRRKEKLQHDLLLTGVGAPKGYDGAVLGGAEPVKAELRLFEDLLVVMPERGLMWGLPYSFIDQVGWDQDLYEVRVADDLGEGHVFGMLAKRSEEFRDDLTAKIDALARRTAQTLGSLVPGLEPAVLSKLAGAMRDGRTVQQRAMDRIDPELWARLEQVVVGTPALRSTYDALKEMTPPGWAALGVKGVLSVEENVLPDVRFTDAGDREVSTNREDHSAYRDRIQSVRDGLRQGALVPGMPGMPGAGAGGIDPRQLERIVQAAVRGATAGQPGAPATEDQAEGPELPEGSETADEQAPGPDEQAPGPDEQAPGPDEQPTRLWYFTPLAKDGKPLNCVAQEVTSEGGHATYVFRLMEPERFGALSGDDLADAVTEGIARLNRALLTLNFRREPIYLTDDQITAGAHTRYAVALRKLGYLRWTRTAFLGRAIHKDDAAWRAQLEDAIAKA